MSETREYISCPDEMGNIKMSENVLAVIAAAAVNEVEGVNGLVGNRPEDVDGMPSGKKLSRSIAIQFNEQHLTIRIGIQVKYGFVIPEVGCAVQEAVKSAIENTTGLTVDSVDVHVIGITFPK